MKSMSHDQLRKRDPHITDEEIAKLDAQSDELLKGYQVDRMLDRTWSRFTSDILDRSEVQAMVEFILRR